MITYKPTLDPSLQPIYIDTALTGFQQDTKIEKHYNWTAKTVTFIGDLSYQVKGVAKRFTSPFVSPAHGDALGTWFLYSIDGINLVWSQVPWKFEWLLLAAIRRNATADTSFGLNETHGIMDPHVHESIHNTQGTRRTEGCTASAGSYVLASAVDGNIAPLFESGALKDEDLATALAVLSTRQYTHTHIGAGRATVHTVNNAFPFKHSGANTPIQVNNVATGSLSNPSTNNRYVNVYQVLTPVIDDVNSQRFRFNFLQPQKEYTSLALAQAEETRSLDFGDLGAAVPEYVIYARLTYLYRTGNANTGKVSLAGISYIEGTKQQQVSIAGYIPTQHDGLDGVLLSSSADVPYGHLSSEQLSDLQKGWLKETQAVTRLSTNTFSLPSVSNIRTGLAVKLSEDNITYFWGLISNITGTTVTVESSPLPATINHLYYGDKVVELSIPLSDDSLNTIADNINNLYENSIILVSNSKLVSVETNCKEGNATINATINIRKGTLDVNKNKVLTDANDILTANLAVNTSYNNSGVTINPLYNTFNFRDFPLIDCISIGNANATGIVIKFYFINNY